VVVCSDNVVTVTVGVVVRFVMLCCVVVAVVGTVVVYDDDVRGFVAVTIVV